MVRECSEVRSLFVFKEQDVARSYRSSRSSRVTGWNRPYWVPRNSGAAGSAVWAGWSWVLQLVYSPDSVELYNGRYDYLFQRLGVNLLQHHINNPVDDSVKRELGVDRCRNVLGVP